jgi:hypothetical protein
VSSQLSSSPILLFSFAVTDIGAYLPIGLLHHHFLWYRKFLAVFFTPSLFFSLEDNWSSY